MRASTGSPVQETNCHPFRHGRWIFLHNGFIRGYEQLRRELVLAIEPELFTQVEGTTDWEVLFFLALTFGLADEPLSGGVEANQPGADQELSFTPREP